MLILTRKMPPNSSLSANLIISLTAVERTKTRHRHQTPFGSIMIQLPRGTVLQNGDLLQTEAGDYTVQIVAEPEPVLTVTAKSFLDLLRAAYHLGNRHIPLEITASYLRLSPDPVLQSMLEHLGLEVCPEIAPFEPEGGAYDHH
ncbi:urease accessory protein UreE [Ancylothrix sp. C2]|uniref:urease accessory protein UreE n=1 Tax=Ancylothrix sp. D3o TaxID=2953691 RepID=UPI0021BADE6C|nr:urease accessory protein UreE [Ancylothrix sp. D3o]MCT7951261.1 urease accessory protein UreE [Ancylothrix sp. D3o]